MKAHSIKWQKCVNCLRIQAFFSQPLPAGLGKVHKNTYLNKSNTRGYFFSAILQKLPLDFFLFEIGFMIINYISCDESCCTVGMRNLKCGGRHEMCLKKPVKLARYTMYLS